MVLLNPYAIQRSLRSQMMHFFTFLLLLFTFKQTIKWLLQTIDKHKGIYNKWFHKIKNKTHHKSFFLAKIWYEYPLNE